MTRCASDIIDAVATAFEVPRDVMLSDCRAYPLARPRFAAMKLIRSERCISYPIIGRIMGRHHTTVIDGERRAEELLKHDPDFAARYERARG